MSNNLNLALTIVAVYLLLSTLNQVRKNRISIKYSLIWIFSSIIIIFIVMYPKALEKITNLFGFQVSSSFIVGLFIVIILLITRMLTIIVSEQNVKIRLLIQEVSMLKKEKND